MPAIKFIFKYLNAQQPDMINQVIESESRSLRSSQTNKIKISENIKKGNFFQSIVNKAHPDRQNWDRDPDPDLH